MRRQWGAEPGRADASPRQSTSNIGHTTTSLRLPVLPAMTVSTPSSARHRPKSVPLLQGQALATAKGRVATAGSSLPSLQCGSPSTTASRQRQLQVQEIADRLARLPGECASPRAGQPRWSRSAKKAVASRTKPAVDPVSPLSTSSSNRDTLKCIDDITPSWTPPLRAPVVTVLPPFALLQSEEDVIGKLAASALDSGVDSDADAISVKVDCIITEVVDKVKSRCNIGAGGKHTQQTANASMEQKEHELGSAETRTATTITIASVATTKIQSADILGRDNYVSILTADGQETIPVHIAKLSDTLAHIIRACGPFKEALTEVIALPHMTSQSFRQIVDYLYEEHYSTRATMVGNNDETSAEQVTFQPELDTLLDLIMDAHYLGVSGLVQVCIVHAVKNFHDIDSLGDLVVIEPVVFQLLEQLPIYQLLRAEKMLPDTYNLDDIWLAKYTTLLRTGGRPRMRDVHSAIDDGTCRQSCVEEFVHQLLDMGKTEQAITLVEQYGDAIRSFRISSVVENTQRQPATLDRLLTADKSIIDLLLPHLHQLSKLDIHGTALSPAAILQLRQIIQRQSGSKLHLQLISCNIALQSFRKLIPSSANSVIEGGAVRSASLTTVNHGGMRVADDERRYLEGALRRVNEEQRSKPSQPTIRQQPFDLSIRNWSGSSSNIATLASLYQSPIVVTSLSFRGMALGELGAEWIAEYLTLRSCPVVNLELARCKLGAAGLQAVCSALAQSSVPLIKLNLSDNYLSSTGMEGGNIGKVLAAALQVQAATLEELDLSGNVLGHLGAVVLIQAIAQSHALRQLDLCRMDLTNGAVRALLQGQFPYLERLALAQNRIVPSQLVEILAWLRQHALQLTTLDIGLNMWNDNVAQTLTDFLLSNTCRLTHLDVEGHPDIATFSRIGSAQLLRSGVMHNHTLTHLNISAQQLSTDDACALIQFGLYGGSKLKQLYIRDNNIERVLSETSLAKALPSKRPLLYVDASGNPITMDVAQWTRQTIAKRGLPLWVDFH